MSRHELTATLNRIADAITLPEPTPVPSHRKAPAPRRVRRSRKGTA